ncbi:hypothetical protein EB796_016342 [Bugula neritina]|uniref:J domain-containing protein n=1 Tax=Bugula neritina TaxID=10212 RepID=A0A7J7JGX3_BUGNE|nr:hypothetical protein EB796_016342 [Bugula neritina]
MAVSNYFKDLELEITATGNDVRTAYKRLAKQWHPDKNKESGAEEKFKQILAAYNHLQSDDRRETLARELKRQSESKAAPTPKPPPQPPPSAQPPTRSSSTHNFQQAKHSEDARPKSSKSRTKQSNASTTKTSNESWWDNYKSNNSNNSENKKESNQKTKFKRTKFSRNSPERFMHSFMNFDDPFDDILFSIFMIPPSKSPPKSKPRTDPFGNKLPNNLMSENIYDWKSATKGRGQQPDYQEYLDGSC